MKVLATLFLTLLLAASAIAQEAAAPKKLNESEQLAVLTLMLRIQQSQATLDKMKTELESKVAELQKKYECPGCAVLGMTGELVPPAPKPAQE